MGDGEKSYALITGASKGIGKSIAIALAKRGFNLLLIARSETELHAISQEIRARYNVATDYLAIDLGDDTAPVELFNWISTHQYRVHTLINNAGYGLWGDFSALDLKAQLNICQLNMDTVVALCHLMLPLLLKEKQAYILNVASTAAYQAMPTLAIYSATKAFVLSFSRAIRYELRNSVVSVSCLSPGPVDTDFAKRAGMDAFSKMAEKFNMQPDDVAEIAVKGMLKQKAEIIPGFSNRIGAFANRILPKAFIEKTAAGIYRV